MAVLLYRGIFSICNFNTCLYEITINNFYEFITPSSEVFVVYSGISALKPPVSK